MYQVQVRWKIICVQWDIDVKQGFVTL